jgi:hypothetical protein
MIDEDILRELLKTNPEYVLAVLIIILSPVIFFLFFLARSISTPATDWQRRHLVKDLLNNPAIQERMKDPTLNLPEFIEQLLKGETAGPRKIGLFEKMTHDITWDVSGIIGLIVTIVLMIMSSLARTLTCRARFWRVGPRFWDSILGRLSGERPDLSRRPARPRPPVFSC